MMEEQKKEYIVPELTVVEMGHQAALLDGSDEANLELGLAPTSNDRFA